MRRSAIQHESMSNHRALMAKGRGRSWRLSTALFVAIAGLAACGGGGGGAPTFKLGGTVTGLEGGGVVLEVAGQTVTTAYGATTFEFPNALEAGTAYNVTIKGQPSPQRCTLANGQGTMGTADVANVAVTCSSALVFSLLQVLDPNTHGRQTVGNLVEAADGFLYGNLVTQGPGGNGSIIKVRQGDGLTESIHSFTVPDAEGSQPTDTPLLGRDGALYIAGQTGGTADIGSLFRVTTAGTVTNLFSMTNAATHGRSGSSALMEGPDGSLYGTTAFGGPSDAGVVFQLLPTRAYRVLHAFQGAPNDGANPLASTPIFGSDGFLYGATLRGGNAGAGVLYRVHPDDPSTYTVLKHFSAPSNFLNGSANSLLRTADGTIYGSAQGDGPKGFGTIFKFVPGAGASSSFQVVFEFSGTDGANPRGALLLAKDGNFYGTTVQGGTNNVGVVYRLTPTGSHRVLHHFRGSGADMLNPAGGLTLASDGALYGLVPYRAVSGPNQTAIYKLAAP